MFLAPMMHDEIVLDEGHPPWSYMYENKEVILHIYIDHPIFKACKDVAFLTKIAKIDAFCSIMTEQGLSQAEADDTRENLYWTLMEE